MKRPLRAILGRTATVAPGALAAWNEVPGAFLPTGEVLRVRSEHPRLLVTEEWIPELRCKAGIDEPTYGAACEDFGDLRGIVDRAVEIIEEGAGGESYEAHAFLYLLTGDARYCALPRTKLSGTISSGNVISPVALACDWCWGAFTPQERESFANAIAAYLADSAQNWGWVCGQPRSPDGLRVAAGLRRFR